MKTLFKSAFFTFFRSRVSMVLLAVLIFLSTITFTILSTTSQALNNSYNAVVSSGRLHDFTVKEKYNINGKLDLQAQFVKREDKTYFKLKFNPVASSGSYRENITSGDYQKIINETFKSDTPEGSPNRIYYVSNEEAQFRATTFKKLSLQAKNNAIKRFATRKVKKLADAHIFKNSGRDFRQVVSDQHGSKLDITSVKSIAINSERKSYKVVNAAHRPGRVNELVIFQGSNVTKPMGAKELEKAAKQRLYSLVDKGYVAISEITNKTTNKGYKAIAYYDKTFGATLSPYSYTDPSALMAVVSPSYFQENNLQTIEPKVVAKLYEDALTAAGPNDAFEIIRAQIVKKYNKSVVWIDSTPYFIVGVGTTPDFAFPIIDQTRPIPNIQNQAVVFVNNHGYQRITDAFQNHPKENYLAYRFKAAVSNQERAQIIASVEKTAKAKMAWGRNVARVVSQRYDTSESIIMAPHRIATINNFKKTISFVTYAALILLVLFAAFVVVLVIKRQINANKKTYGILLANGYSKAQIALSNISIALLIGVVPTILGYTIGVSFQWAFFLIFKDYWTIPINNATFDIFSLALTVLIPIVGISLLAFIASYWSVRGRIPSLISGASGLSRNLNLKFISPLKWIRIRFKTSLALFLSNLPKMFLVFLSIAGSTVAISNALSIYDKFYIAKSQSLASTNYEYKLNLANPTAACGLMKLMPVAKIGLETVPGADDINSPGVQAKNMFLASTKASYQGKSKFMVPNLNDQTNSETPFYLDGIVQQKALLNVFAGLGAFGVGPWQIAEKLMPENQLNQASQQYENFINFSARTRANTEPFTSDGRSLRDLLIAAKYLSEPEGSRGKYVVRPNDFSRINAVSRASFLDKSKTTKEYTFLKQFIFNGLKAVIKVYNDPRTPESERLKNMPFFLSYRNIIADEGDETFTRLEGKTNLVDNEGHKEKEKIDITGVKAATRFINFSTESLGALTRYQGSAYLPVIANRFFLFRYKKQIGDTFKYQISNHKDRFSDSYKPKTINVKIVGAHNSYASSKIYTLQSRAARALGWDVQDEKERKMFNGIFTSHKNSILFKSLSVYSPSGLYPKVAKIIRGTPVAANIAKQLQKTPVAGAANLDQLERKFTLSPYVMVYKDVSWRYTNEHRFNSLVDISSKLIYIVQGITLSLALLFILIIALMMIFDSKKFISTMRVMGYRRGEISRIFFISFAPALVLAFFTAAPISFGIAEGLRITIASYSNIYIPIALTWWTIVISTIVTFLIVLLVYLLVARHLRKIPIQQAFE